MAITAGMVKELRERTGAGMMDCKVALTEADGNIEKAADILREKGMADSVKKAGRIATEGVVESYIHMGGKIGVLVEVNCETDFVAKTEAFHALAGNIAMHIAAANPRYLTREEVDPADLEHEKQVLINQALQEGKPEAIVEKMVEGRMKKFYGEVCLMEQAYVKAEDNQTIEDFIKEAIAEFGENIKIRRFVRFELGEGLEKKVEDFAAEVDMNVIMNKKGEFIEVQGTGEESTFTRAELNQLLDLAENSINRLIELQDKIINQENLKIFLATANKHKINEISDIFSGIENIEILSINDGIEIPEVIEDGETFEENSKKKAVEIAKFLNMITIADDSGLCVDALNGEPGVYSARYSGTGDDLKNNEKYGFSQNNFKN